MYQGESFQEIIQRYNRELLKLQKQARRDAETWREPTPAAVERDGMETEGSVEPPALQQPVLPEVTEEDTFVNYVPDALGVPEGVQPPGTPPSAGEECLPGMPMPLPDDIIVPSEPAPPPAPEEPVPDGCACPPPDLTPTPLPLPLPEGEAAPEAPCEDIEPLHSQTVGENGPVLLQDGILHETLETFISGTQLSRPLHIKGWSASGTFRCYRSMKVYTSAGFLQEAGAATPVRVRFSQAAGAAGSPDTTRNIRGFATKFYTAQGNFDIVGNDIPVFFVRDAIRFPEVVAALSPSPETNLADPWRLWNLIARTPEAVHMVTWLYSDVGTVKSYRRMRGYGINTFVWRNADGARKYVKYHWLPLAGELYATREEAEAMLSDPDALGRELYRTIAAGTPVEYELNVQLMDPREAEGLSFDPLDDTKTWNEKRWPLLPVGRMTLTETPNDYEQQVEKLAFSPANLVEGIELSDDKMLQGRSFIYWDSQRRRLGKDFREIPVNRSRAGLWAPASLVTSGEGVRVCGDQLRAEIHNPDNFTQAGERYRAMDAAQRERLADNIAAELYQASGVTQSCVIGYLYQADAELGDSTRKLVESYMKRREG